MACIAYDELFGLLLEHLREKAHMTPADVAGSLGVSLISYEGIEDGVLPLQVAQTRSLARVLKTTPETLVRNMDALCQAFERRGHKIICADSIPPEEKMLTEEELWEEIRNYGELRRAA